VHCLIKKSLSKYFIKIGNLKQPVTAAISTLFHIILSYVGTELAMGPYSINIFISTGVTEGPKSLMFESSRRIFSSRTIVTKYERNLMETPLR
jgi:hypothetical protein